MITKNLNISADLCKGCGTCEGVCPHGAVKLLYMAEDGRYLPFIDKDQCIQCGLCLQSCPAWPSDPEGVPFKSIKSTTAQDLLGPFQNTYSGFSNNRQLRRTSSSGGLATAVLLYALRTEQIDTALVVKLNEDNPFGEPQLVLAKTETEIVSAIGSKYLPVPLNRIIKQIITREDIQRIAIVGLPCHIEGIRKARHHLKKLDKKIAFTIGLFCRQTKNLGFTKLLLSRLKVDPSDLQSFSYRGGGWPGYVTAKMNDGNMSKCLFFDEGFLLLWLLQSFAPKACMFCCDPTAEYADISVADAWIEEFANDKEGVSLIVARTNEGESILNNALRDSVISTQSIDPEKVVGSQIKRAILRKKINYRTKVTALKPSDHKILKTIFNQKVDIRGMIHLKQMESFRKITSSNLFVTAFQKIPSAFFNKIKKKAQKRKALSSRVK